MISRIEELPGMVSIRNLPSWDPLLYSSSTPSIQRSDFNLPWQQYCGGQVTLEIRKQERIPWGQFAQRRQFNHSKPSGCWWLRFNRAKCCLERLKHVPSMGATRSNRAQNDRVLPSMNGDHFEPDTDIECFQPRYRKTCYRQLSIRSHTHGIQYVKTMDINVSSRERNVVEVHWL